MTHRKSNLLFKTIALFTLFGSIFFISKCKPVTDELTISFSGDVMLGRSVGAACRDSLTRQQLFAGILPVLAEHDFNVANLECVPGTGGAALKKAFNFRADPGWMPVMKRAGFTHVTLANNHSFDFGEQGLIATRTLLGEHGIAQVGSGTSVENACRPVIIKDGSTKVAVFSHTSYSIKTAPGNIALCDCSFSQFLHAFSLYAAENPSVPLIVNLHWGQEYNPKAGPMQKHQAQQLIDSGADVIIGHHPHVIQDISFYKGVPVLFSLGNLVFDQNQPGTDTGLMLGLSFSSDTLSRVAIYPVHIDKYRPDLLNPTQRNIFRTSLLSRNPGIRLDDFSGGWILREGEETVPHSHHVRISLEDGQIEINKLRYRQGFEVALILDAKKADKFYLDYDIYHHDFGDIDGDGVEEAVIGVIKQTTFDPETKRRLFIIRKDGTYLRPLWLGSNVCERLYLFKVIRSSSPAKVLTIEEQEDGLYCIGEYVWQGFGLTLNRYTFRNLSLGDATKQFNE